MLGRVTMANYSNYCLKPDYFTGVSGWKDSGSNDQWLIKNRGNSVMYKQISQTRAGDVNSVTLFLSTLHYNRDEPHGAFCAFVPKGESLTVDNGRGYSTYFQCKGL